MLVPVLVLWAGCARWCCELAAHVVETGCWCRCWCWVPGAGAGAGCRVPLLVLVVPGAGAGAGAVSWLCAWWRKVDGAGTEAPVLVPWPAVHVV